MILPKINRPLKQWSPSPLAQRPPPCLFPLVGTAAVPRSICQEHLSSHHPHSVPLQVLLYFPALLTAKPLWREALLVASTTSPPILSWTCQSQALAVNTSKLLQWRSPLAFKSNSKSSSSLWAKPPAYLTQKNHSGSWHTFFTWLLGCPILLWFYPILLAPALPDSVQEKASELNLCSPFLSVSTCQKLSSYLMDLDALYRFLGRECLTMAWTPRSCICAYRHWRCVCLCIYPSTQLYSCFRDSVR